MSTTKTCPHCGAPLKSSRICGWGTLETYACGLTYDDGPGAPCGNRDERATRDETTQPPEAEELTLDELEEELGEAGMAERFAQHLADEEAEEAEAEQIPETLPAPLTAAEVTERELRRLETYRGEVLADVTDAKAAKALDEKRKEVKRVRTTAARICKDQREEAIRVQKEWVAIEKGVAERLGPVEDHLEAEAKRHDDWKAEQARIAEQARLTKIKARVEALVAIGLPLDMHSVETLDDECWSDYLADATEAKKRCDAATAIADELTALGDECTPAEVLQLTDDQIEHRLGVARKADHDRREAKRIADEEAAAEAERVETERQRVAAEEKAARERLERGYRRGRELALLGAIGHDVEPLADMTEEAFQVALETARQEKEARDARIAEERRIQDEQAAELARLKQAEADRLERERQAIEAREREAKEAADKADADAKAARDAAEREVRHHGAPSFAIDPIALAAIDAVQATEAQEIEEALAAPVASWSVQVTTWFSGIRAAIEASPDKNADTLAAVTKMLNAVKEVEDELLPF